jgi:hypothetical protein
MESAIAQRLSLSIKSMMGHSPLPFPSFPCHTMQSDDFQELQPPRCIALGGFSIREARGKRKKERGEG